MNSCRRVATAIAVSALLAAPPARALQDVRYETVTKSEFAGAMGTMMRMAARMGGGSLETTETTSIKGRRMRTDTEKASSIVDMEAGRIVSINHEEKTYFEMTFAEMAQMMQRAAGDARAAAQQGGQRGDPAANPETQVTFRFSVDRARDRERIAGYDASRAFITIEAEGEYKPEGGEANQPAGTLVLFTDMWSSTAIPALTARQAFDTAAMRQMANASASMAQGLSAAFARDPKLRAGMEKAAEEAAKIEGMPVRTITRMVFVPAGQPFDRTAALAPAAQNPAQPSLRGALSGMMRGRAGGGQQPPGSAPAPTQATFMTVTTEVRNVTVTPLDLALFQPPAGYRRTEMGR